ncbi:MAG: glycosyltransferase family 2 protein, partial [Planctomycetota bacterium]
AASTAPWLMFLNSDAQLRSDTAGALVAFLQARPDAAAVGPQVLLPDGAPQPKTCGHLPGLRRVFNQTLLLSRLFPRSRFFAGVFTEHVAEPDMEVGWISGVCMVLRREAFAQVGGFDPEYFLYAEDLDLCRRLRGKGWTIHRLQAHAITHVCGASTRSPEAMLRHHVLHQRNYLRLLRAHNGPCGYACACGLLAAGLAVRVLLRGLGSLLRRQGEREAAAAAWQCLRDLLVPGGALPGENHAHRD